MARRYPYAFAIMTLVALRADDIGNALIGHSDFKMSRQNYRTSLKWLERNKYVSTKATALGTIASVCDSRIYNVKFNGGNQQEINNVPNLTTSQPQPNQKVTDHLTTPSLTLTPSPSSTSDAEKVEGNRPPNHQLTTSQPPANHQLTNVLYKDLDKDKDLEPPSVSIETSSPHGANIIFDIARKAYPLARGKMGLNTEFAHFKKKHKDWRAVLPLLLPAIELQVASREVEQGFLPPWKHFRTWINNRCWEEEAPELTDEQKQRKADFQQYNDRIIEV